MSRFKAVLLLFTVLTVLVGCGGTPGAETSQATSGPEQAGGTDAGQATSAPEAPEADAAAPAAGKQPLTISLWTHDALYVKFFNARAKEWAEQHPEYQFTFDFQQVPDVWTKVLSNLAAGEPVPDLLGIEQSQFPNFMKDDIIEQYFVDLAPMIGAERDKFYEGRWSIYQHKGKVYGVESGLGTTVYYYQPAIFEKAGVDPNALKTWDDFMAAGEKLAKQGTAMMPVDIEGDGMFSVLYLQRGGRYFNENGEFILDKPENRAIALEVLQLLKDGLDRKIFWGGNAADFWGPPIFAAYQEGKLAGAVMPDWYSDYLLKPQAEGMSGKWRMMAMPVWKAGGAPTSTWGGTGFAISKQTKNVDLVWDLLHYTYMTKENQLKRFEEIHYLPTMKEAMKDQRVTTATDPYFGGQTTGALFAQIADEMPVWYQSPFRSEMSTELVTQLTLFYKGEISAEEAIDTAIEKTKELISQAR